MANVEFEDFSIQVKGAIEDAAIRWLEEGSSEIQSAAQRNSRRDTGEFAGKWTYKIVKSALKSTVGHPDENALWEEFGTGEYAVKGNGRKGGWYVPEEKLTNKAKGKMQRVVIKGKVYYFTRGKKPNRTLEKAYTAKKNTVINLARQIFGELK